MVRLTRARPFTKVSSASRPSAGSDGLRIPTFATFADQHTERHLVLHRIDHKQVQPGTSAPLLLDRQDLAERSAPDRPTNSSSFKTLTLGHDLLRLPRRAGAAAAPAWRERFGATTAAFGGAAFDRGLHGSFGSNFRRRGLRARRFRGSLGSLFWHCASFVL